MVEIKKEKLIYIVNVQNGYPNCKRGRAWEKQELWSGELAMGNKGDEQFEIYGINDFSLLRTLANLIKG